MDHVAHAEVLVEASPERVWQALTSGKPRPEIMFGARTTTDWRPGSPITWSGEYDGNGYKDHGEVLEAVPDFGKMQSMDAIKAVDAWTREQALGRVNVR